MKKEFINIDKEFIPYEEALFLKEIGFDEFCAHVYFEDLSGDFFIALKSFYAKNSSPEICDNKDIVAPSYRQAFSFFREKYKIEPQIESDMLGYAAAIVDRFIPKKYYLKPISLFQTYEEAELACLKRMIELVREK